MKLSIAGSLKMQERAKQRIPGMTQLLSKRPDRFSLGVWPGYYDRAQGCSVWDLDGNHYIDMSIAGIGANVLGYADPDVDAAVREAIAKGSSCSLNCPEEIELADVLCELHPWAEMVRYARSGGEAMAVAVRISRSHTGRDKIAFCGYHGWQDWYLAANLETENALGEHLIAGLSPRGVPRGLVGTAYPFSYNNIEVFDEIIAVHGKELAAVVMEPLRWEYPRGQFLRRIRSACDAVGAVLVFDEVSSGFRISTGGAHLVLDAVPDIAVFSKALGNGYPIAAVIGKTDVMQAAQISFISSTNWTERVGPAAALAVVRKFRHEDVSRHLGRIGELVQSGWKAAAEQSGLDITVGGIPPLSHFHFNTGSEAVLKAYFVQLMLEDGFLASNLFYAMYAHQETHMDRYLSAVSRAFGRIAEHQADGGVERHLAGQPATAGFQRLA
jgi:glutamate-1-semialdehyde 2,1-aminomutase